MAGLFTLTSTRHAVGVSKSLPPTKALVMTFGPRLATLVLLASTVHLPRAHAQTSNSGVTEGLWEAKRRFGPDVRGPLSILQGAGGWRAEVAGVQSPVRVSGDTVSFTLLNHGGSLIAYLSKDRTTISGHWIQPGIVSSGNELFDMVVTIMAQITRIPRRSFRNGNVSRDSYCRRCQVADRVRIYCLPRRVESIGKNRDLITGRF